MRPTRRDTPFREAMRSLLVFDGAMGSLLYERGIFVTQNFEQLNVTRPDVVAQDPRGLRRRRRAGHRDQHVRRQLASGSTATASATRCARTTSRARGSRARRPARTSRSPARWARPGSSRAWRRRRSSTSAAATFAEQAAALVEGGVDLLVLETFRHLEEIRIAIEAARRGAPEHADHRVDGVRPERDGRRRVRRRSTSRRRCATGAPTRSASTAATARSSRSPSPSACAWSDLPLCVQPNAGLPRTVDGRLLYMATPEYFDVFARRMIQLGATMIGGCCGTTPEHVRWMAKSGAHARRPAHRRRAGTRA